MGLFNRLFGEAQAPVPAPAKPQQDKLDLTMKYEGFDNSNLTPAYGSPMMRYDIPKILLNTQLHIQQIFQLVHFYREADPIVHGIIYNVLVPFTLSSPWQLHGSPKTNKIYEAYYKKIRLDEHLKAIATELVSYNNVYVYMLDGVPITLPVNRCSIGGLKINGEPLVNFDTKAVLDEFRLQHFNVRRGWIADDKLETLVKAYPPEVAEALNDCADYVQLNPKYTFVLQGAKDGWDRYAVPFLTSALMSLQQKALIRRYEAAILNLGIHSFVHTQYGGTTKERDIIPSNTELTSIHSHFRRAMSGFPLVTTSHLAKAYVVQPDMDDLFQWDKYKDVNNDILSAGGISGVLVTGTSSDGATFASAQVSMQMAEARIEAQRRLICELMDRINVCIKEELEKTHIYNVKDVPTFTFMPLEMSGRKALREEAFKLWQQGVLSTHSLMYAEGYDLDYELEQRKAEAADGVDEVFCTRLNVSANNEDSGEEKDEGGRPTMDDDERHSDPEASERGAQPKPSTS